MRSGSIRSGQLTPGSFDLVIKVIEVQLEIFHDFPTQIWHWISHDITGMMIKSLQIQLI